MEGETKTELNKNQFFFISLGFFSNNLGYKETKNF